MSKLTNLFRWQRGRQETGYYKMLLCGAKWPVKFDMYLLKFPTGCVVLPHVDTVKEGKHYRLNLILRKAREGGNFNCTSAIFETERIKLFRPDIEEHSVSNIMEGNRCVLSIGWVRPELN